MSDLFRHYVRCDKGIDHGPGIAVWMHPPVHRILGWASRPSAFQNSRHVWRLNQIRGVNDQQVYVKGEPALTDPLTLDLLPSLIDAHLLNKNGEKIGIVADFIFNSSSGQIINYLISRSDPRLPGTSRWTLNLDRITDQHPGRVEIDVEVIDELPLSKSSFRQDFLRRTRTLRDQIEQISSKASDKLEGWLEEPPWDDELQRPLTQENRSKDEDPLFDWEDTEDDFDSQNTSNYSERTKYRNSRAPSNIESNENDPWI